MEIEEHTSELQSHHGSRMPSSAWKKKKSATNKINKKKKNTKSWSVWISAIEARNKKSETSIQSSESYRHMC